MSNALCFVLMPFGKKPDSSGRQIDFDAIYQQVIQPAIQQVGLEPIRADEEVVGGIIHKPMFERLILCEYAVADLTTANANVFYELGIRHALRPWRTVAMFASGMRLPFDVAMLRSLPYDLGPDGVPADPARVRELLIKSLESVRAQAAEPVVDSPVYQLMDYLPRLKVDPSKTDVLREQMHYSDQAKRDLAAACKTKNVSEVNAVLSRLRPLPELEGGVLIDAMKSFRALCAWDEMIAFIQRMPRELQESVMVQEQLGFALNRAGRGEDAEKVLLELLARRGPSPETLGILGRVYKDWWEQASKQGDEVEAAALLDKAIETYVRGFEADWRDSYPGVNALTLMEIRDPPDPRRLELQPIVRYAVQRKMAASKAGYWEHATLLELSVLEQSEERTRESLGNTLMSAREFWEPETTARNLRLIRECRERRGLKLGWAESAENALLAKVEQLRKPRK